MKALDGAVEQLTGAWWVPLAVVVALAIALAGAVVWATVAAAPLPGVCDGLAVGQVDVTQAAEDVLAVLRETCAG